jgi:hypothetical protein
MDGTLRDVSLSWGLHSRQIIEVSLCKQGYHPRTHVIGTQRHPGNSLTPTDRYINNSLSSLQTDIASVVFVITSPMSSTEQPPTTTLIDSMTKFISEQTATVDCSASSSAAPAVTSQPSPPHQQQPQPPTTPAVTSQPPQQPSAATATTTHPPPPQQQQATPPPPRYVRQPLDKEQKAVMPQWFIDAWQDENISHDRAKQMYYSCLNEIELKQEKEKLAREQLWNDNLAAILASDTSPATNKAAVEELRKDYMTGKATLPDVIVKCSKMIFSSRPQHRVIDVNQLQQQQQQQRMAVQMDPQVWSSAQEAYSNVRNKKLRTESSLSSSSSSSSTSMIDPLPDVKQQQQQQQQSPPTPQWNPDTDPLIQRFRHIPIDPMSAQCHPLVNVAKLAQLEHHHNTVTQPIIDQIVQCSANGQMTRSMAQTYRESLQKEIANMGMRAAYQIMVENNIQGDRVHRPLPYTPFNFRDNWKPQEKAANFPDQVYL